MRLRARDHKPQLERYLSEKGREGEVRDLEKTVNRES